MCRRSSSVPILDVAWRSSANRASSGSIPHPSSVTLTRLRPPAMSSTSMRRASASRLFSTNSLTTEAGRSTTSPAAMRLTRASDKTWIVGTRDMPPTRCSMLDARCSMLDARCSMLDARCSMLDARCSMLDARCSMLDARCSMLDKSISHPADLSRGGWADRASSITAVQNKSTGDVAHLITQGLRVGFRPFRGEVPFNQLMLSKAPATATGSSGSNQWAASESSVRKQRQPSATASGAAQPRSGDRWIARGVSPGSCVSSAAVVGFRDAGMITSGSTNRG